MSKQILIKPIISEKSERLSENFGQYSFIVNKSVNKVEIKKEIEKVYGVNVKSVSTAIMPGKTKIRNTKSGMVRGGTSAYKKAIVSVEAGETIDFFGDI